MCQGIRLWDECSHPMPWFVAGYSRGMPGVVRCYPKPGGLSSLREVNEAAFEADGDGVGTVCGVELLEDVKHVDLNRGLGPPEGNRDLLVALPLRHVGQDFQLAIGQVDSGCELRQA